MYNLKLLKINSLLLAILLIFVFLLLSGCETEKSNEKSNKLIGKWDNVFSKQQWNFMANNSLEIVGNYHSYSFIDNNSIKISWLYDKDNPVEFVYNIEFSSIDDDLKVELTNVDTGDIITLILIENF